MIIDFNKTAGGGVTPEQVEQEIQSALTPYWESGETKDYVDEAVSGIDLSNYYTSGETDAAIAEAVSGLATEQYVQDALSGVDLTNYWTSAETEEAISAATAGKADAANVTANTTMKFPLWNEQGVITGTTGNNLTTTGFYLNGTRRNLIKEAASGDLGDAYAPVSPGNAGDILVSAGNGAPVWSALTFITSADVESQILDKNYVTSAQTEEQILAKNYVTSAQVETQVLDKHYVTSAQTEEQILGKNYVVSGQVKEQIEAYEYVKSGQVETQILAKNYITAEDIEPDIIYEAEGNDPGFYAINSSALTTWQIENLDLSDYEFVRFYIKASDIAFNSGDNFTAPMYVDVVLDPKSLSSQYQAYLGVTTNICAGNRNRSFHTIAAVDITKSKVQLLYQTSLWDITVSSAANNGRYCYKIVGYRYNVCGAGEQGGGGETYTAGPNINISPANVISVSGLSTINGSAITNGGNLVIQGGDVQAIQEQVDEIDEVVSQALVDLNERVNTISAATPSIDLSAYYTSAQTEEAIVSKNYVTSAQTEEQILAKDYVSSTYVSKIWKGTQVQYDAILTKDPNTFYIIVNN